MSVAAGISVAAGQASAHSLPAAGAKAIFAWKWLAIALTATTVAGGLAAIRWSRQTHRAAISAPATPTAPVAEPPTPIDTQAAAPVAESPPALVGIPPVGTPTDDGAPAHRRPQDPSSEHTLVEGARAALQHNDIPTALRLCARHEQLFPRGSLAEERDSVVILALGAAHRTREAASRATRFRAHYPGSLFLPAVDAALENATP